MPTYVLTPSGPCLAPGAGPWLLGPRELPALDLEPRRSGLLKATGPTALLRGVPVTSATRVLLTDGTLTLHFSQQMVYPIFNKPEIAEKFRLAVQKLTGQNIRVVMQPMDTVTQINQRTIEELAHFPNVTIR